MVKAKYYGFDHEIKAPFRVDLVDLFQAHDEYGYDETENFYCVALRISDIIKKS